MNTYIALFRGINVGGNNLLPMKDLAGILTDMGCEQIKSYIQSGNVVFRIKNEKKDELARKIGSGIMKRHGFEPKVILLEKAELQAAIENNPFNIEDGKALYLFFLDSYPENPDLERLEAVKSKSELFKLNQKVFYLFAPEGIGRSKLAAKIEQCLGIQATARNWNTVRKLISMVNLNE